VHGRPRSAAAKRGPIAEERIVVLKKGAGDIERLASRLGATIVGRMDALGAYRLRFEDARRAAAADGRLASDPDVASVESNFTITPPAVLQPLDAGGAAPPRLAPDISPSSDKVLVGLIDMPVQEGTWLTPFLEPGISVDGTYQPTSGTLSHGTAMAETVLDGVARALAERGDTSGKVALSILPIDVYGGNDATNMFSVAQGLFEALTRHVNVVNLSLGGDSDSPLLRDLTQAAAKHGVVVVAAAGNEPVPTPLYPAADPGVISVTASDAGGSLASYANTGRWVDTMAPGENIMHYGDKAWYGMGTSFATSWVSGWAAGYLASPGAVRSSVTRETLDRWQVPARPR
jgi:subtilase family protein/fervidolysin-like protein